MQPHRGAPDRRRKVRAFPQEPQRQELASTVLGTYSEMPGLVLRLNQAARLFALEPATCEAVLDALLRAGRLRRTSDGQYALRG